MVGSTQASVLTAVERGWPLDAVPGDDMAAALRPLGYDCRQARLPCKKCCEAPCAMRNVAQQAEGASREAGTLRAAQ